MKKENDELTNLFRSRLGEAGIPVREGFWENLQKDIPVVISRRRQLIHRFTAAASVLLVLAGASAAFWYFSPKEEIANAFTQMAVSTGTSGKMGADAIHVDLLVIQASTTSPAPASSKPMAKTEEYVDEESFSVSFSMSVSISSSSSISSNTNNNHQNNTGYNGRNTLTGGLNNDNEQTQTDQVNESTSPIEKEKNRKWSVGAYASAGFLTDRIYSDQMPILSIPGTIKHKMPFSAGLSVRRELNDRWGIESGLVYTQLNSESTAGDNPRYTQDQTLHYIGIPVKADFNLYKSKHMDLYASAGGMVEKCVSGKVETKHYENGINLNTKTSITPDPLQLSLNAAIGLQYKLSDRLSVYAEPGLSYHFDDGSSVSTIRKEKPLNLNLLCGVRMTY